MAVVAVRINGHRTRCPRVKKRYCLQGKSQIVQEELVKFGEQMVSSSEGTRALALELCREFEDKFLQHLTGGEIVLEADGYQPYLISPEKGLRSLIKGVLELAKEPSRLCVDENTRGGRNSWSGASRPQCQVCGKFGHIGVNCYNRFNQSFTAATLSQFLAQNQQRPSSNVGQVEALLATPEILNDDAWFADSGSSHHLTNNPANLQATQPYTGADKVLVANGSGLISTSAPSTTPPPTPISSLPAVPASTSPPANNHPMLTRSKCGICPVAEWLRHCISNSRGVVSVVESEPSSAELIVPNTTLFWLPILDI
ncbi:dynamin-2A-like isoform X2 [Senna tora]|uniref:Dynamin-2A-like isoform X2 n=1 Tax=Senna tora TaxID=362788 RepID=A0A834SEM8_9FABA|nr:dynamin-2A-like isoform X2 [Senna tora]